MSIARMPGQAGVGWGLAGVLVAAAFVLSAPTAIAQAKGFTIEQALSAPYASDLHAAPSRGRLAWEANIGGRRNLWVAEPAPDGKGYLSRQITHFTDDDGQDINTPEWTAEAASIVYVRGDSAMGENHPVPNPAGFPKGAQQQLWVVSAEGGEPRLLGEGQAPAVSPDGKQLAYTLKGRSLLTTSLRSDLRCGNGSNGATRRMYDTVAGSVRVAVLSRQFCRFYETFG